MVGYTLRQERERQNLSINDIEQGTSIRALYIEAIENGEYDKLPGTIYTKGFIKNYAKFLNMDADALAKEFMADIAELSADAATANASAENDAAQPPENKPEVKPVKQDKKPLGYSIQDKNRSSSGLLIVAAVVIIAAIAGGLWSWLSSSEGGEVAKVDPPQQQTQQAPQPTAPEPVPQENPTPVANANPAPQTPADKVAVQARFNDRCWALVTVDGNVVQEGVIEGGQTLSWEGKENITFRLGNAGAVEFFQDGKSLGVQGGVGDVVDKTFTRK
ncbi:MAG: helix-turn-helix domain-containing protein [Selenomonadaceae bacterium]|nr:helix-turn-helix domain-containing protein [Selenomonadaceae bacterium]